MYRGNWFSWGSTGLALATICLLAPWAKNAQKVEGIGSNAWRLAEPTRYENLSVFPVVSRQFADTTSFVSLDEALSAGQVVVTESGANGMRRSRDRHPVAIPDQHGASVNQLVLINHGSKPLILLAGELVSGGKQDRIIGKDRIIPPGAAPLPLDVFCVEAGRWSSGAQFSAGQLMVHPSVREKAVIDQEQAKVWDAVRNGTTASGISSGIPAPARNGEAGGAAQTVIISRGELSSVMATEAPTQSYSGIYKTSKVGIPVDTFTEEVQKRFRRATANLKGEFVVGVVVAYGGEVAWSDIFASPMLFELYWPKLLRSYAVEALARTKSSEQASTEDAREFLMPLVGHESIETELAAYRLRQVTEGRYVEMELEALRPVDITLHILKIHRTN